MRNILKGRLVGVALRMAGRLRRDDGMTTAEYAVGTLAACAFAGVLYKVLTSGTVLNALSRVISSALSVAT